MDRRDRSPVHLRPQKPEKELGSVGIKEEALSHFLIIQRMSNLPEL